jgi:hypothetical protein
MKYLFGVSNDGAIVLLAALAHARIVRPVRGGYLACGACEIMIIMYVKKCAANK